MDRDFKKKVLEKFLTQFYFEPQVYNKEKISKNNKYIFVGMGGSGLSGEIIKILKPEIDIIIWKNYKLPNFKDLKERVFIFNSYSGNTEEIIHAYKKTKFKKIVITSNGELLKLAKKNCDPYIQIPNLELQPRFTLIAQIIALLKILDEKLISEIKNFKGKIDIKKIDKLSFRLAKKIYKFIPVFYSSFENRPLAYLWKIKINENSKIPAFHNFFPELNHNEIISFSKYQFSKRFYFIFLCDKEDDNRIKLRMKLTKRIYKKFGLKVFDFEIFGKNKVEKLINSLLLSDFTSLYLADFYREEPTNIKIIEDFKNELWKRR